jgi:hypothetical protein
MQNNVTLFVFFALSVLAAIAAVPGRNAREPAPDQSGSGSVLALFGGNPAKARPEQESLFQSEFWRQGVSDKPIADDGPGAKRGDEPDLLEPTSEGNPVNPETGRPYSDQVMEQFSELRKKFPNNSIIPRRRSPEDVRKEEADRAEIYGMQTRIFQNKASPEEIDRFYDFQAKGIQDRLELLEYVLAEQSATMSPDIKKKYDQIVSMNKNQLQSFEEARKRAKTNAR